MRGDRHDSASKRQVTLLQAEHLAVTEPDRAGYDGVVRRQPEGGQEGLALARTAFADNAEALALVEGERHAPHGFDVAVRRVEGDAEIGDLQYLVLHRRRRLAARRLKSIMGRAAGCRAL